MAIREIKVDHSTIQIWVFKFSKEIEKNINRYKKQVTNSWRLDETYIKVARKNRFLHRAVDKQGKYNRLFVNQKKNERFCSKILK